MPDLKSFKQSFKKNALKLFFLFALIGLIGGSFLSLSFMGQHEKIFQMGQFTFKELDVQKSAQIYQALNPDIKDKSNEKIQDRRV